MIGLLLALLVAFNKKTGALIWKSTVLVGDYLYGTQSRGGLLSVEFTTGKVK